MIFDEDNLGESIVNEVPTIQGWGQMPLREETKQSTLAENANKLFDDDDSNLG